MDDDGVLPPTVPMREILGDTEICSELHRAVRDEKIRLVERLLKSEDSFLNLTDSANQTPLHYLADKKSQVAVDIATMLVNHHADINLRDKLGATPLHVAVSTDAKGIFSLLISLKTIDVDVTDIDSNSPLHVAVETNNMDMARALLEKGAIRSLVNLNGNTPLMMAKKNKNSDLVELFIKVLDQDRIDTIVNARN